MEFSELEFEWHPTANGTLTASEVHEGSYMKVWWICSESHEWEASVVSRLKGKGCPVCVGRSLIMELLSTKAPQLMVEYHPTKNGRFTTGQVHEKSSTKVLWICSEGHEWEATLNSRVSRLEGCLDCGTSVGLSRTHPDLASEWHPTKNGNLQAHQTNSSSSTKVWWVCSEDHEWEASVANRVRGKECPMCVGRSLMLEFLSTSAPNLLSEYHPTKNGKITASQVHEESSTRIWWICSEGHEWEASIVSRVNGKVCRACCSYEIITALLEDMAPALVSECHPDKNRSKEFNSIVTKSIWWFCPAGHEWQATIAGRGGGKTCPFCLGKKVLVGSTDLLSSKPNLAKEWHPTKNGNLTVHEISIHSNEKFWWSCAEGHEWKTNPSALLSNDGDSGCPLCCNQAILTAEWHPTKNIDITIEQLTPQLIDRVWWVCSKGHEWYCSFRTRVISGNLLSECALCSNLDRLVSEWHPTKNETSTVEQITTNPKRKMRWFSLSCGHEWESTTHDRTKRGSLYGCPFCSNSKKVIRGETDFLSTHPEVAAEWHPTKNGNIRSDQITSGTNTKHWWLGECGHEWEAFISNRLKGYGCSVCFGYSPLNDNKFASLPPELAAQWHPTQNGNLTAEQIHAKSRTKFWWLGSDCGHEWEASPRSYSTNSSCPVCSS